LTRASCFTGLDKCRGHAEPRIPAISFTGFGVLGSLLDMLLHKDPHVHSGTEHHDLG
jgi:hypothetical protein